MIKTMSIKTPIHPSVYTEWFAVASDIFNQCVEWAFENKTYNKNKCHHSLYQSFRGKYPNFPSALIQCVRDTALEAVKQNKFKHKPHKKNNSGFRLNKTLITLKDNNISVIHPNKRFKFEFEYPEYFSDLKTAKFRSATLNFKKATNEIILNLQFEIPDANLRTEGEILGVDCGLYNVISCSNGFQYKGNQIRKYQRKTLFNKRNIQAKGTKSAKRKLKKLSGKQVRFSKDVNHCLSKCLVNTPNIKTIVFENLKGIRKQRKGRKLNKWLSSWTFYQLQTFTKYKALSKGIEVAFVDPRYTSQKCSNCGNIDKKNRNQHQFKCTQCDFKLDADLNAALNIKQNYILSLTNKEQVDVNQPIVTSS